jgi:hypothetical protein
MQIAHDLDRQPRPAHRGSTRAPCGESATGAASSLDLTISGRRRGNRPRQHTHGVVGALNAEWRRLVEDRGTRAVVRTWAEYLPALRGLKDLSAVLSAASRPGNGDVLAGLLVLARGGDELAARAALQAMLGAAVRLARRTRAHAGGDLEESIARAVAATWQVIRSYPIERRRCRPADGISLDVLAVLTAGRSVSAEIAAGLPADLADRAQPERTEAGELREAFWSLLRPGRRPACGDEQVIVLLAWAVRSHVVSAADARLLVRLHSPDEREGAINCGDVAAELGLSHAAVRQRVSRATRRLAAAVQAVVSAAGLESYEGGVAA